MSPAVNVTLEEVPFAILEAVKARILANRRRLRQAQKPRPSLRPRPQFRRFGANSKAWRPPQYGGGVFATSGLGHVWLDGLDVSGTTATGFDQTEFNHEVITQKYLVRYTNPGPIFEKTAVFNKFTASTNVVQKLGSVTGSLTTAYGGQVESVESVSNFGRQDAADSDWYVIPVGEDVFIVICLNWHLENKISFNYEYQIIRSEDDNTQVGGLINSVPSLSNPGWKKTSVQHSTSGESASRIYVCSNVSIRPIAFPAKLSELLQFLNPPLETEQISFTIYKGQSFATYNLGPNPVNGISQTIQIPISSDPQPVSITQTYRPAAQYIDGSGTPDIFAGINTLAASNNLTLPINPSLIKSYTGEALQRDAERSITTGDQRMVAYVRGEQSDPDLDYVYDRTLAFPDESGLSQYLADAWDWDDPDYCRAMCKALGFTEADLTP